MAKLAKMLGEKQISGLKGKLDFYYYMGIPCVRRWPMSPGPHRSPGVEEGWTPFRAAVHAWVSLPLVAKEAYAAMAAGTALTSHDLHMRSYLAGLPNLYEHEGSPPPPPNPEYWALTAIRRHSSPPVDVICANTDTPCHLWLRFTTQKTWIHRKPVLRRGIYMHTDLRYCFVAYIGLEQREPSDTLSHSFVIPTPSPEKTTLFYLYGYILGNLSPSTSPVFASKYRSPLPYPTIEEEWTS